MSAIKKVAVFGATGNFGTPITAALAASPSISLTIITRPAGTSRLTAALSKTPQALPPNITGHGPTKQSTPIPIIQTEYTLPALTAALAGQDAVITAVNAGGIPVQKLFMDASEAAGVQRFMLSEFGYGDAHKARALPDFDAIGVPRLEAMAYAKEKAERNEGWGWCAVGCGIPIDWALVKITTLGFDVPARKSTIYDSGTEPFTGTTLAHIGAAVLALVSPSPSPPSSSSSSSPSSSSSSWLIPNINRQFHTRSLQTTQTALLHAFEARAKLDSDPEQQHWTVSRGEQTTAGLIAAGREKVQRGEGGWTALLMVGQLLEEGAGRGVMVDKEGSDDVLLGIEEMGEAEVVEAVYGLLGL